VISLLKKRPLEPVDLDFAVSEEHIPSNILRKDIGVGDRRHLINLSSGDRTFDS
jgi:hypothetical protein